MKKISNHVVLLDKCKDRISLLLAGDVSHLFQCYIKITLKRKKEF